MVPVLLVGSLVSMFAVGVALAAQEEGGQDKSAYDEGSNENGEGQVFELEGRPTTINGYVDLGQQGLTPGELYKFSEELHRTAGDQDDESKTRDQ